MRLMGGGRTTLADRGVRRLVKWWWLRVIESAVRPQRRWAKAAGSDSLSASASASAPGPQGRTVDVVVMSRRWQQSQSIFSSAARRRRNIDQDGTVSRLSKANGRGSRLRCAALPVEPACVLHYCGPAIKVFR